jgi:hypothetical protein
VQGASCRACGRRYSRYAQEFISRGHLCWLCHGAGGRGSKRERKTPKRATHHARALPADLDPAREERLARYRERAAARLPLFAD